MADDEVANRLEALEITVEDLSGLPEQVERLDARVESLDRQFLHFREDVASEFSAVRREMKADSSATRGQLVKLHDQMFKLHEEVMGQIAILQVDGRETRAQLLALYESLRADIRSLRER